MIEFIKKFYHLFDWHLEFERSSGKRWAYFKGNVLGFFIALIITILLYKFIVWLIAL